MTDPRFPDARYLHRQDRRDEPELWSASCERGMIATAHYRATEAGVEVLERGGNAIDAAVAASFALAVCESAGSGIGGMCMMMVHLAQPTRTFTIEGPCRAPAAATPEAVAAARRYRGYAAVAVPTYLATLEHAIARYATMPVPELLAAAIRLAEDGYPVTDRQHELMDSFQSVLRTRGAGKFFLDESGAPRAPGSRFRQPVLAATLRRLAEHGLRDFYEGAIAREIDADMAKGGGFVRASDLAAVHGAREADPIQAPYASGVACTLGPPGGGLALAQLLQMLAARGANVPDPDSPDGVVWLAGVIQRVRQDRRRHSSTIGAQELLGAAELCDPAYAAVALREVEQAIAGETTHLSVMDAFGNAVGITQSVERNFGSAVATDSLGFVYNGYLRAFKVDNPEHPHFLKPGAVARSNAAPTIVLKGGRPWIVIGSTGSERMVSGIFETLLRLQRQDPFRAVAGPRLHCTPRGVVLVEADRFTAESLRALERRGFTLDRKGPYAFTMGGLQLVVYTDGRFVGVAEPRRDGAAGGPARLTGQGHGQGRSICQMPQAFGRST